MSRSVESKINNTHGTFLELGAVPSNPRSYPMINLSRISKRMLTSNVYEPEKLEHLYKNRFTRRRLYNPPKEPSRHFYRHVGSDFMQTKYGTGYVYDDVDLIIDAEDMPLDTGSAGALYAVGMPADLEASIIGGEAARVLEPGGVLVLEKASAEVAERVEAGDRYFDVLEIKKVGGRFINFAAVRNGTPFATEAVGTPPSN